METALVLKKYSNRRLYDTDRSLYITLADLAGIVRQGRQVKVVDARSGEDVTAFILTQILLEEAKNKNALLPAPLLHLIIRFGNNMLGEFFESYLQQIIQVYLAQKATFEEQFKHWIVNGMNWSAMASKRAGDLGAFKPFFDLNPFFKHLTPDPGRRGTKKK